MGLKKIKRLIAEAVDTKIDGFQETVNDFIDNAQEEVNGLIDDAQESIKKEVAEMSKDKIIDIIAENKNEKEAKIIHTHKYNKKRVKKEELKKGIPVYKKFIARNIFKDILFYDHMTSQFIINVYYCDSKGKPEPKKRQAYIGNEILYLGVKEEFLYITHKNEDNETLQFIINLNNENLITDEVIYENDIEEIEDKEPYRFKPLY